MRCDSVRERGILILCRPRTLSLCVSSRFLYNPPVPMATITQFAMVQELAFLIKDNLPCKHLVLSMEETFVNFLQDDTSPDGVLELEPMNSYNRLLLHRLADIFGFAHESVGEGDNRHLVLERSPDSSIPSVLVSDILWQCDEPGSFPTSHQLLAREETPPAYYTVPSMYLPLNQLSLEEREAAYLAARDRIFSIDDGGIQEPLVHKPRSNPVVARRMIAHALGKKITSSEVDSTCKDTKAFEQPHDPKTKEKDIAERSRRSEANPAVPSLVQTNVSCAEANCHTHRCGSSSTANRNGVEQNEKDSSGVSTTERRQNRLDKECAKAAHLGAAKRMFAHALGLQSGKEGIHSKVDGKRNHEKE